MLRLPGFEYRAPATIADACAMLADGPGETMVVAGGTDLIPNMKRRQQTPRVLVGLRRLADVHHVRIDDELRFGAAVTLTTIVSDARLRARCPGLWQAAAQIATPHLRNMGTIGGNLCLDTRCTYYDQSADWRRAIGYCMKKDGETCWVATSSPRCLAVSSTDTAPMLQALGARVRLVSTAGERTIALEDLYRNDGMQYLTRQPDELLTDVIVPDPSGWVSTYWKVRRRGSFDFPVASAAAALRLGTAGDVLDARIVLGAVASRPMASPRATSILVGHPLTDDRIAEATEAAYDVAKPMDNTDFTILWRKRVIRAVVAAALRDLRGDDVRALRLRMARQIL